MRPFAASWGIGPGCCANRAVEPEDRPREGCYDHDSIPLLVLDFCLIQLWVGFATSPYQALLPDLVPKERQGVASGYMGLASILGNLGGLFACMRLIQQPDGLWHLMLTISMVLVVAMLATVA